MAFKTEVLFSIYRYNDKVISAMPISHDEDNTTHIIKTNDLDDLKSLSKKIKRKLSSSNDSEIAKYALIVMSSNMYEHNEFAISAELAKYFPSVGPLVHSIETQKVAVK